MWQREERGVNKINLWYDTFAFVCCVLFSMHQAAPTAPNEMSVKCKSPMSQSNPTEFKPWHRLNTMGDDLVNVIRNVLLKSEVHQCWVLDGHSDTVKISCLIFSHTIMVRLKRSPEELAGKDLLLRSSLPWYSCCLKWFVFSVSQRVTPGGA